LRTLAEFYHHESCGQCTPCREGGRWLLKIVRRIESGEGKEGDIELMEDIAGGMLAKTLCPLGDAYAMPVLSFLKKFRKEFEEKIRASI